MDNNASSTSSNKPRPAWVNELHAAWRTAVPALRRYGDWLGSQSWKRLTLIAVGAIVATAILSHMPPFSTRWGPDKVMVKPARHPGRHDVVSAGGGYDFDIDDSGVRIRPHVAASAASAAASGGGSADASAAASPASAPDIVVPPGIVIPNITVKLPRDADKAEIRSAIADAKNDIRDAINDAREEAQDGERTYTVQAFRLGDHLLSLTLLVIVASIIAKVMGTGRKKAEVQAAVATELAESELLKRQVIEARMAAMQAQVEPHFLFNTLASIDHLIETDPPRASIMQKNLIALLRASMPTMRETAATGVRDLGRELAVVRPYLEILKVRMEERLQTEIDIPDGLVSAEFPPMMIQSLVENAIKHGLEPKAEGGKLLVRAEIRHGLLCVIVADTGLGFGKAATSGTGVGLANIRERLQLLYGDRASVTVTENQPSGTVVTITVPYTHRTTQGGR